MNLPTLNFPTYEFTYKQQADKTYIFDFIRKKYVLLTPEEWVRQHIVHFLIKERNYPKTMIAVERGIRVNKRMKRCDIIVYQKNGIPLMIVECKRSSQKIKQETFNQVARYNLALKVKYLLVTNGLQHFSCLVHFAQANYTFLDDIPYWETMNK
ncbi:MAG: type I restriction enzyme HsdR N-terminal domain-containing protein [Chitinophagales bacterium]